MKKKLIILLFLAAMLIFQVGCKKAAVSASKPQESASILTDSASASQKNSAPPSPSANAESTSTPTEKPTVSVSPSSAQQVTPTAAPSQSAALPYSQETNATFLHITGSGVDRDYYFSLADLQSLTSGYFSADYFSRGKDPKEDTNAFTGIRVSYLLDNIIALAEGANQVIFTAGDGYAVSYSLSQARASFIDETVPDKALYMILAWEQDGTALGNSVRLIMGQTVAGEYNRMNWVRDVITVEIKAV